MYGLLRSLLFTIPAEDAHRLAFLALAPLESEPWVRDRIRGRLPVPASAAVTRMGLSFPSPIGLAGGFDKNARRVRALAALGFGFLEVGTVTAEAQEPNPSPNLFRLPDDRALINRLGFPNDGASVVATRYARSVGRGVAGLPVAFSIGKSRSVPLEPIDGVVGDYLASFRAVRDVADFVVVNVSSPNTKGLRALQGAELARTLLGALAHEGSPVPLLLKISPDLSEGDLDALLDVVADVKLDGLVATNTTLSRAGLTSRSDLVRSIGDGGLSGPPLRPRALEVVRRARARLGPDATLIGVGGIETGEHARAFLDAGANLVQLYTGFIYGGPRAPTRIARELVALR
jgi:dihydroorotate dehydrogenase